MFNRIFMVIMVIMLGSMFIAPDFSEAATCTCNISNQTKRCPVHRCYGAKCQHGVAEQQRYVSPQDQMRMAEKAQRMQFRQNDQYWKNIDRNDRHEERSYRLQQRRTRDTINNGRDTLKMMRDIRNFYRGR